MIILRKDPALIDAQGLSFYTRTSGDRDDKHIHKSALAPVQ